MQSQYIFFKKNNSKESKKLKIFKTQPQYIF
jgi:hypothetical protein